MSKFFFLKMAHFKVKNKYLFFNADYQTIFFLKDIYFKNIPFNF